MAQCRYTPQPYMRMSSITRKADPQKSSGYMSEAEAGFAPGPVAEAEEERRDRRCELRQWG